MSFQGGNVKLLCFTEATSAANKVLKCILEAAPQTTWDVELRTSAAIRILKVNSYILRNLSTEIGFGLHIDVEFELYGFVFGFFISQSP